MAAFRANGIITLTTDFGAREPFVGIMKGVMLGHAPHLRFIDMAHEVSAFQPVEAGFWLAHAIRYFPAGTLHLAVVDPGVGTPRALIVAMSRDQALLAPDNGLLAPLAARGKIDRVIKVDNTRLVKFGVSDYEASKAFFLKALAPLGVTVVSEGAPSYGVELSPTGGKSSLCLFHTTEKPAPLHLAFVAETRRQVDEFHRAALAAGARDNGPPGLRPHYHPSYYAAFVIGPDGHNIEVVCHEPQA